MEKRPTEYDLWLQTKRLGVRAAADVLESIADAKQKAKAGARVISDPSRAERPSPADAGSDFLYDLLHLQFQYVERLATLQGEYRVIAKRTLERWYSALSPVASPLTAELVFDADHPVQYFALENRVAPEPREATITWEPLRGPRPLGPVPDSIALSHAKNKIGAKHGASYRHTMELPPGDPTFIGVEIFPAVLTPNTRYQTEIVTRIGDATRRLNVSVTLRDRK
ncbi:MAG TPA: hypothetical protein VMI54_23855 [Polyangiaceae bacterium]|nr:hypothetical protein [Polyangiaceae bacterium]